MAKKRKSETGFLKIFGIVVGVLIGLVALFALATCIYCACKGVTFGSAHTEWFKGIIDKTKDTTTKEVAETALNLLLF